MLALLLACAAPVIASYFTYYVIRPEGRRNFGELVQPQRPVPDVATVALDGSSGTLRALKGQWLLVSVAGGACEKACQDNLYLQRQLRESLGKEKDRLDWVWLVTGQAAIPAALAPALKGATVLRVDAGQLAQWLAPAQGQQLPSHLYVVDPLGNWMMRLPPHLDAAGAAKASEVDGEVLPNVFLILDAVRRLHKARQVHRGGNRGRSLGIPREAYIQGAHPV